MQIFFRHQPCIIHDATEEQHATPTRDQDRISHHSINTISSRQVMKIEKNTRVRGLK